MCAAAAQARANHHWRERTQDACVLCSRAPIRRERDLLGEVACDLHTPRRDRRLTDCPLPLVRLDHAAIRPAPKARDHHKTARRCFGPPGGAPLPPLAARGVAGGAENPRKIVARPPGRRAAPGEPALAPARPAVIGGGRETEITEAAAQVSQQ